MLFTTQDYASIIDTFYAANCDLMVDPSYWVGLAFGHSEHLKTIDLKPFYQYSNGRGIRGAGSLQLL